MYVFLNFVFLYTVPAAELSGKIEIGYIYASRVFGVGGGKIMGTLISVLLLSTISSMIIAGPRISKVIGEDYRLFRWMAKKSAKDIPYVAILTQGLFSIVYIMTSTFDQVVIFIGFTLNLFTFLTVLGVIIMRVKHPEIPRTYKTWGYPVTPIIFLVINIWILVYGLLFRPYESLAGIGFTAAGVIVYFINKLMSKQHASA
jgi:APA family basic amino acid/polyamine antiporter